MTGWARSATLPLAAVLRFAPRSAPRGPGPALARVGWLVVVVSMAGLAACGDDARSVSAAHRLVIEPCRGSLAQRASAAAIGPDLLVSVAHSFEGARAVEVTDATGRPVEATVVHLDPAKDIALLATDRPLSGHLALAQPEEGGSVAILTYGEVDGPRLEPGRIVELVDVTLDGEGRRAALRLAATIEPGDSGAAVVDDDGRLVGMVFASARNTEAGWAVSSSEIGTAVEAWERNGPGASLPAC